MICTDWPNITAVWCLCKLTQIVNNVGLSTRAQQQLTWATVCHNRRGPKIGGPVLLFGGAGPHLTQRCLGQDLPPYQVASWSMQPFGHSRHGPKSGGGVLFRSQFVTNNTKFAPKSTASSFGNSMSPISTKSSSTSTSVPSKNSVLTKYEAQHKSDRNSRSAQRGNGASRIHDV